MYFDRDVQQWTNYNTTQHIQVKQLLTIDKYDSPVIKDQENSFFIVYGPITAKIDIYTEVKLNNDLLILLDKG